MMATMSLAVVDWDRSRKADLSDVPADSTVGEVLSEVREAMSLPRETPYHMIHGGAKLQRTLTLEEAGIEDGEEVTIAPEVSAG